MKTGKIALGAHVDASDYLMFSLRLLTLSNPRLSCLIQPAQILIRTCKVRHAR